MPLLRWASRISFLRLVPNRIKWHRLIGRSQQLFYRAKMIELHRTIRKIRFWTQRGEALPRTPTLADSDCHQHLAQRMWSIGLKPFFCRHLCSCSCWVDAIATVALYVHVNLPLSI